MIVFFLKNQTQNDTSPRHSSKNSNLSICLDQEPEISYSLHLLHVQIEDVQGFAFFLNKIF